MKRIIVVLCVFLFLAAFPLYELWRAFSHDVVLSIPKHEPWVDITRAARPNDFFAYTCLYAVFTALAAVVGGTCLLPRRQ